jgi:hypothetical protein
VAERRLHTPRMIGMHRIEAWVDQYRAGDEPADLAEDFRVPEPVLRAAIEGYELGELSARDVLDRQEAAIREAADTLATCCLRAGPCWHPTVALPRAEWCTACELRDTLRAALGEG